MSPPRSSWNQGTVASSAALNAARTCSATTIQKRLSLRAMGRFARLSLIRLRTRVQKCCPQTPSPTPSGLTAMAVMTCSPLPLAR